MAKEITWECKYCGSMNKYKDSECVNCGAPRTIDSQFVSIPSDQEDKKPDTQPSLEEVIDFLNAAAGAMNSFGGLMRPARRVHNIWKTIKRAFFCIAATVIIVLILIIVLNIIK